MLGLSWFNKRSRDVFKEAVWIAYLSAREKILSIYSHNMEIVMV